MFFKIIKTQKYHAQLESASRKGKEEGKHEGFYEAVKLIREILIQKDKVYLEGTVLKGNHQMVSNVAFLGCDTGVEILPEVEDVLVQDCLIIT